MSMKPFEKGFKLPKLSPFRHAGFALLIFIRIGSLPIRCYSCQLVPSRRLTPVVRRGHIRGRALDLWRTVPNDGRQRKNEPADTRSFFFNRLLALSSSVYGKICAVTPKPAARGHQ